MGFSVGDCVCVHGYGFGKVVEVALRDKYPGDFVVVEIPRTDYHAPSRRTIQWTERRHVLLEVYPPHITKSIV